MKIDVKNLDGKAVGSIELAETVFGQKIRKDILARVIHWQLAKRRAGTANTKGISEISGTTAKPWKQKGTGRARAGSLRSPQFRKGATIFGPKTRSFEYSLQKKVRAAGLCQALSAKASEGKLVVLDSATSAAIKTKPMAGKIKQFGKSVLIIDGANVDMNFALSIRNVPHVNMMPEAGANVYDIMRHETLVLTKNAVEQLTARLSVKVASPQKEQA